jgi:hypothetical protein
VPPIFCRRAGRRPASAMTTAQCHVRYSIIWRYWHHVRRVRASMSRLRPTSCRGWRRAPDLGHAALTFSNLAVSRTPRPSSNAARVRCTLNDAVRGLPNRLPDDRARSHSGHHPIADHRSIGPAEHPQHPEHRPTGWRRGIERLLVQVEIDVAGSPSSPIRSVSDRPNRQMLKRQRRRIRAGRCP